ncbi:hypothetical protein ACLOJK_027464 [Asimina triloba]
MQCLFTQSAATKGAGSTNLSPVRRIERLYIGRICPSIKPHQSVARLPCLLVQKERYVATSTEGPRPRSQLGSRKKIRISAGAVRRSDAPKGSPFAFDCDRDRDRYRYQWKSRRSHLSSGFENGRLLSPPKCRPSVDS